MRVETAERLGISVRRFDGWEPSETTEHVYNRKGQLIRSVTTREPEWDETDQAWMYALAEYRASLCPCGCGVAVDEATSDERTGPRFKVPTPLRCRARTALLVAQKAFDNPNSEAMLWRVTKG